MRLGGTHRPHFMQHRRDAGRGDLPGGLGTGQSTANHMDGLLLHGRHGQYLGRRKRGDNAREGSVRIVRHRLVLGMFLTAAVLPSLLLAAQPAAATIKLWPAIEQLYSSVEMEPLSATHMMVCYGFVCRLRLTLVFTDAERTTITSLMNKGRASAAEERK